MLSGNRPSPSDDLGKKLVQSRVGPSVDLRVLILANHDIHVDIAISGMSEARDGKSAALLKPLGKFDEVDEFPARNDDVFVQFFQAGGLERLGERAPQIPEPFARCFVHRHFDCRRALFEQELRQSPHLRPHAARLAVHFEQQMRTARGKAGAGLELPGGLKREAIGHLDGGRKKSAGKTQPESP